MLRGLDLFSGIGGISLALKPWVETVAYCECEPYAQAVLLERMQSGDLDSAPIWDDVRTLNKDRLGIAISFHQEHEEMKKQPLKRLNPEDVTESIRLYESGMSLAELGHLYGVSRQSMHDLLKRRIALRSNLRFGNENHFYRGGRRADSRAHDLMEKAIERGEIINPGICESCGDMGCFADGRTAIQGHHSDYNFPLRVRWLCQRCHHEWHKDHQPIAYKGEPGTHGGEIDIISGGFP